MLLLAAWMAVAAPPVSEAERLLTSAHLGTSGPALVEFLRKRSLGRVDPGDVQKLIRRLGEGEAEARRIQAELLGYGVAALPVLREAEKDPNLKGIKPHIDSCLRWIEGPNAADLLRAVIARLVQLKPAGTSAVLLSFVARGEEEGVEEARQALVALVVRDGKTDPVLETAALKETNLSRRLAAIEILCQADAGVIRQLLRDPSAEVRLHTAALRLEQGDADAVPVLIELLGGGAAKGPRAAIDPLERLAGPLAPPRNDQKSARDAWAEWWRDTSADSLVKFFQDRTPNIDPRQIGDLVKLLGSKTFRVRHKAEQDLINLRGLAVPWLEKESKSADLEVRRRVERCLEEIRQAPDAGKSAARVRLLALRRPAEASRVLLAYVPFADSESVTDEVRQALQLLARCDLPTLAVLKTALKDGVPQRRALAADVLAEVGGVEYLPDLRKLLTDPEPAVRLRAALGLIQRQEKPAIPVLIELLAVLPQDQAWPIEDSLRRLAGDKGPPTILEASEESRKKCRDLWAAWWKEHGERADLALLRGKTGELGLTILSLWGGAQVNHLVEMGRDQKERWRIDDLGYAFDFIVLPGNRLLIAEHNKHRVTERNFKGEILWQYDIPSPINVQRLPNGQVFIAASDRAVIVDRQKNEVTKFALGGLMGGQRYRDGKVALLNGSGVCHVYDANGTQLRTFQVEGGMSNYGGVQATENGHFLVAQHNRNKVSEYDLEGKLFWSCESPSPNFTTRLTNGNTLIGSQDNRSLIEVDRTGKKLSEYKPGVSVWRVRRR